jgi:S-adenosylmethionine decarboxylase
MRTKTRRVAVSTGRAASEGQTSNYALARHMTVELYDCDPRRLADKAEMEHVLTDAARASGGRPTETSFHSTLTQGVSGVLTAGDSRFAVNAWPEHDYAAVDLFSAGHELDLDAAVDTLRAGLSASNVMISADLHRGIPWQDEAVGSQPVDEAGSHRFAWSWREKYEEAQAWGLSTAVDIYDCQPNTIRDPEKIRLFVVELCDLLEMKRFGECQVVNFGDEERVAGFSMTQLIETSLISGHFANASNAAYLDIFSCKFYEPRVMAEYATAYFGGSRFRMQVSLRR